MTVLGGLGKNNFAHRNMLTALAVSQPMRWAPPGEQNSGVGALSNETTQGMSAGYADISTQWGGPLRGGSGRRKVRKKSLFFEKFLLGVIIFSLKVVEKPQALISRASRVFPLKILFVCPKSKPQESGCHISILQFQFPPKG